MNYIYWTICILQNRNWEEGSFLISLFHSDSHLPTHVISDLSLHIAFITFLVMLYFLLLHSYLAPAPTP